MTLNFNFTVVWNKKRSGKYQMPRRINHLIPKRSIALLIVCMLAWIVLIIRLGVLQIVNYDEYQNSVIGNVQKETQVSAQRGMILARDMTTPLAANVTVWRIFISPRDIVKPEVDEDGEPVDDAASIIAANKDNIAKGLSRILGVDYGYIYERSERVNRADETIKRNVEEDEANLVIQFIEENGYERMIHLEASTKRSYPYGTLASHVIGYVGTDSGLFGLELQYDADLNGTPGRYVSARTGLGRRMPFKYDTYIEAKNGVNLVTTIDINMQSQLEAQLEQTFHDSEAANRVTGIIMDVNTGAVRAMGTYPNFDLNTPYVLDEYSQLLLKEYAAENEYSEESDEYNEYYWNLVYSMWKNKAVSELYEPGSTFKILTTAMVLEEGVVSLTDEFFCGGYMNITGYNKPIRCHKRNGHGWVDFRRGLQQSCNPTLMMVAERLGREKFYDYFKAFGYTEKTGIDLPGEASSIFHNYSGFHQVELAVYSFGQTFKVTPLQQITAICTIANGGYLVTPHMVSAYIDDNGTVLQSFDTEVKRRVISTEVCKTITEVLEEGVSTDGGAKNAYVAGYKIAAKTGTSEIRDILNEDGEAYLRVGSCVGYAPADNPQLAMIIIVDQPQCANVYGSVTAAPYIANLMDQILPSIVDRQYTEEEMKKMNITVPHVKGWPLADGIKVLEGRVPYEIVGAGDVINAQVPASGSVMSKENAKVLLYVGNEMPEDTYTVPNVVGLTAGVANQVLVNGKFNIKIDGTTNYSVVSGAYVMSQSPEAGEKVPPRTVVTITLRYLDGTE